MAVSPFPKSGYVSHTVGDHTSILAFIEARFLSRASADFDDDSDGGRVTHQFLTKRDKHAHTLEDLFDFDNSPSANTTVTVAAPPAQDCTTK
jgi:phospholipase C